VALEGGNAENDDKRIHEDTLVPAEGTRNETEAETEPEASQGCNRRDACPACKPESSVGHP